MIPLAQYLSDHGGGEFTPLRSLGERRETPRAAQRSVFPEEDASPRPARSATAWSLAPTVPVVSSGSLSRNLELERARFDWEAERAQLVAELERRVAEARAAGHEEGVTSARAEAEVEATRQAANDSVAFDTRLAATVAEARARWVAEEGDRLADLMILQMAVFEDTMRLTVKNVLRPLAIDARQRQALDEMAEAVKVLVASSGVVVTARGPADPLAALRERLGEHGRDLAVIADPKAVDLSVEADGTQIETRLSAWSGALDEALA